MITARQNEGFTLVELAIVMTIIGLLVGGVLKGQEMMRNAQMTATVKRVQSFQAALSTFEDIYKALPGDFVAAQSRLPNCTAANRCYNGNGNYVLGTPINWWNLTDQTRTSENQQFWTHLALANLISGIDNSSDLEWGRSHPVADFAGGYTAFQSVEGGVYRFGQYESGNGLWLRLMGSLSTNPAANSEVISPNLAYTVDRKYDDGMPWTGWIRATGWGVAPIGAPDTCEGEYDSTSLSKTCIFGFVLK